MMGLFLGKQYCLSHKNLKMLVLASLNPEICCVLGSKNIHRRENGEGGGGCLRVVDGGWVVYMGGYSIAQKSLRTHKSYVFVKQQKVRKREGVWKAKKTEAK